jgi:CheY-like chemotaxis protein
MPELIIIDLNLPRLDGIEVLKKYRNTPALVSSRMMILTSSDSPAERQRAEILGVDAYVRKPILLSEFIQIGATIRNLLDPLAAQSAP